MIKTQNEVRRPSGKGRLVPVGDQYVFLQDGTAHLPADMLHPLILLTCGKTRKIVKAPDGRELLFMRAADIISENPALARAVRRIVARTGCFE